MSVAVTANAASKVASINGLTAFNLDVLGLVYRDGPDQELSGANNSITTTTMTGHNEQQELNSMCAISHQDCRIASAAGLGCSHSGSSCGCCNSSSVGTLDSIPMPSCYSKMAYGTASRPPRLPPPPTVRNQHTNYCHLHATTTVSNNDADGFVQIERRLMHNLLLLSITSSVALGIVYTLISLDRYFFGPWTFLGLSAAFLIGALSVYYAQACVTRFGPNRVLSASICSVLFFVFVHFSSSFFLFQLGIIVFALCLGPFYAAQLDFVSSFTSRLVYLTPTIKRHQEERYQRLFHLIMFCPSQIVGHLAYIVIYQLYYRISGDSNQSTFNDEQNSSIYSEALIAADPQPSSLMSNKSSSSSLPSTPALSSSSLASSHVISLCTKYPCRPSVHHHYQTLTSSPNAIQLPASSIPLCFQQFQQQYCDQSMYYIFSFNRYQPDIVGYNVAQPFSANFTAILIGIFVLVIVLVLAVVLFLLHRTKHFQIQDPLERSFLSNSIRNVLFRTFHDHHLRLLLPMAFFVGLEQGFFVADFNKLYVSCALGLDAIGFIMLTRGCVHFGATLLVHEFVRHINRPLILLSGAICQLGVLAILCLWRPNDDLALYYVITTCWALSNAIWETLLLTNILRTFCAEEWNYALLTLHSFTCLGLGASFGVSEFVCLYIKLYALMAALVIAILPMKLCEIRLIRLEKILGPGSASHI